MQDHLPPNVPPWQQHVPPPDEPEAHPVQPKRDPRTFRLEARWSPRNGHRWTILGLPDSCRRALDEDPGHETVLWTAECGETADSAVAGVFSALYDLYQCDDELQHGDMICSDACLVYPWLSWDVPKGMAPIAVPPMSFRCDGVHVVPANDETYAACDREYRRQVATAAQEA